MNRKLLIFTFQIFIFYCLIMSCEGNNDKKNENTFSYDTSKSIIKEIKVKNVDDSLNIKGKIKNANYNQHISKIFISKEISPNEERLPDTIINQIEKFFYQDLLENKIDLYNSNNFQIKEIQLYNTKNDWIIYSIVFGRNDIRDSLIGCYNQLYKNYFIKKPFEDICSSFTFKTPEVLKEDIKFIIIDNYSCVEEQEEIYSNTYVATKDSLIFKRKLIKNKSNMGEAP